MVDGVDRFADRKYGLESSGKSAIPFPTPRRWRSSAEAILRSCWHPQLPFQIPAKAYDYLGTGVRILAIAEDGGTSDLIRDTGSRAGVRLRDIDGIEAFIHEEMAAQGSATPGQKAGLARFDARRITEELASHLDRVARMAPADAPAADARHS